MEAIIFLAIGFVLLIIGGNFFVDSAAFIATKTGMPKIIVGATVVSIATTTPEMIVSFFAAADGKTEIAVGNAVGSAVVNTSLILALSMVFMPMIIDKTKIMNKSLVLIASSIVLLISGLFFGELNLIGACILFLLFIFFMYDNVSSAKAAMNVSVGTDEPLQGTVSSNVIKFVVGAGAVALGSRLLVDNASLLASNLGVSDRVIAVTIVALGTSLPELITAILAISRKMGDLSAGNIIGANIINLALVQPACAFISGNSLEISDSLATIDIPICCGIFLITLLPPMIKGKFYKKQGMLLIGCYLLYLVITFI